MRGELAPDAGGGGPGAGGSGGIAEVVTLIMDTCWPRLGESEACDGSKFPVS
jgi:hypothetical protein